jgi:hypothetical protein
VTLLVLPDTTHFDFGMTHFLAKNMIKIIFTK